MNSAVSEYAWNWNDCFEPSAMRKAVRPRKSRALMLAPRSDQDFDHFVQAAECRAVEGGEVGFVDGVDVGAGVEQHVDGLFGAGERAPALMPGLNVERPSPAATISGVVPSSLVSAGPRPRRAAP